MGVYKAIVIARTVANDDPVPADSSLSYTVEASIDGRLVALPGVKPPEWVRPDPDIVDVDPIPMGAVVMIVGEWAGGRFDGFLTIPRGELPHHAECGG